MFMKIKRIFSVLVATTILTSLATATSFASSNESQTSTLAPYAASSTNLSQTAIGFASGTTGGGNLSESSTGYAKVSNATELGKAFKKGSGIKVIEIMNDIDLGWNVIGAEAQVTPISANNSALTHPTLIKTGVSKVKVDSFNGLTIYSKNGAAIKHAGFTFKNCSNVIIQNVEFDELWEWDEYSKGDYDRNDWDFITLENCSKVWIDHCTFGKAYDGVVDSKKGTSGLTISWSKFLSGDLKSDFYKAQFDYLESNQGSHSMYSYLRKTAGLTKEQIMTIAAPQKKTHLVGANELKDDNNLLELTLCYNYYLDSQDRMPRLRGGNAHIYNIIMDSQNAYNVSQILTSDIQSKISSSSYKFGITSNGAISTENGAVMLENCIIKGVKYPIRNNQKGADKANYTGKILAQNCQYTYGDTNFTGNSTDSDSPLSPVPAEKMDFSWNSTANLSGGKISYAYTMYSLSELQSALVNSVGTTTGGSIIVPPVETTTTTTTIATETTTTPKVTTVPTQTTTPTVTTEPQIVADAIYCSPNALADGKGTKESPMAIEKAITSIKSGGTIYMLEGNYAFDKQLTIAVGNDGESNAYKSIKAYPNANVTLDFSAQSYNSSDTSLNARGLQIEANYWYIYGIRVYGSADNGIFLAGNNNIVEMCVLEANRDTGLQVSRRNSSLSSIKDWPSNNLILNCTSFNNMDTATGENADGFAAKLTCGVGNVFDGCIAYNNVDDGWDLYTKSATGQIGAVTIKNCIAFRNGQTSEGVYTDNSDGNGFKLGGSSIANNHFVENCISFENKNHGFTDNSNPGVISLKDCTSYNNSLADGGKSNFDFARSDSSNNIFKNIITFSTKKVSSDKYKGTATNSSFYNSQKYYLITGTEEVNTRDSLRGTQYAGVTASDFVNLDAPKLGADVHTLWRNADGTINTHGFLMLAESSSLNTMGAEFGESSYVPPVETTPEPVVTTTETTVTTTEDTVTTTETTVTTTETTVTTTETTETTTESTVTTTETAVTTTEPVTTPEETETLPDDFVPLYGDVNLDGEIGLVDVIEFNKYFVNATTFNAMQKVNANCYDDDFINMADNLNIAQFLCKKISTLGPQ